MTGALLVFGTALGAGATLIAVGNWWAFFASLSGRTRISFVPLVGGGLGAVATFTFWLADAPSWCVAGALSTVLLDWGSGLGLLTAPLFYARYRLQNW